MALLNDPWFNSSRQLVLPVAEDHAELRIHTVNEPVAPSLL